MGETVESERSRSAFQCPARLRNLIIHLPPVACSFLQNSIWNTHRESYFEIARNTKPSKRLISQRVHRVSVVRNIHVGGHDTVESLLPPRPVWFTTFILLFYGLWIRLVSS